MYMSRDTSYFLKTPGQSPPSRISNTLKMLEGYRTSPTVLPDPETVRVAVVIALLSRTLAEIYATVYVLQACGSHVWLTVHPDVGEYSH